MWSALFLWLVLVWIELSYNGEIVWNDFRYKFEIHLVSARNTNKCCDKDNL